MAFCETCMQEVDQQHDQAECDRNIYYYIK
jgi:hypothetical protein